MPLAVHVKHAGKVYDVQLDTDQPPLAFKQAVYQLTGVPVDRMKVMIKGGVLKDDTDWAKVAPKSGQTLMVVGTAGELPKPPEKPIVFLEDMDDTALAEALAMPVGLKNLGNTCYMNATVQAMRAIPELQIALNAEIPTQPLPKAIRDLYATMTKTTEEVVPSQFLQVLRHVVPQFAELSTSKIGFMRGWYAQQDAEECWTQLTNAMKDIPGLPAPGSGAPASKKFVEQYMMGEMRRELRCGEAPDEKPTTSIEKVLKIECNISISTYYLQSGIMDALNSEVEKNSPSLGRQAVYTQTSRVSRLPAYLTVHMVRFAWKADINKKAKILKRVKFPEEFDALDIVTDELKAKIKPVSTRLKEIEKERTERRKVRRKMKVATTTATKNEGSSKDKDVEMADATQAGEVSAASSSSRAAPAADKGKGVAAGELEDESVYREKEIKELEGLVSQELRDDVGCSYTGQYELVAIVTHKGAAADSGHYMSFVKKSIFHVKSENETEVDEDWYKFDDERVSIFPREKLGTLDGGGEDSAAYVLLYKTKSLA